METEYAVCFQPSSEGQHQPTSEEIFEHVIERIAWRIPVAQCSHSERRFLANGSSIALEQRITQGQVRGLLEGATPECRSPATLLAYQKAQDDLLSGVLKETPWPGHTVLIKNSADAVGQLRGSQENYEVEIARGWRLAILRVGLCVLLPMTLIYWALACLWMGAVFAVDWLYRNVRRTPRSTANSSQSASRIDELSPRSLTIAVHGLRILHKPLAWCLYALLSQTAIVPLRRHLASFLVTRQIIDGAGHLDSQGKFWLSARATGIDSLFGLGGYWGERPVFLMGHWLKQLCVAGPRGMSSVLRLFRRRQRIQIGVGDSGISDWAQYLRIGMTTLVIDMVEQGEQLDLPQLSRPIQMLGDVARDDLLIARSTDRFQIPWSALDVQRQYLQQVRRFLQRSWRVPGEAWRITRMWQETLDQLQAAKHNSEARDQLLGKIDWVSKKWMLEQVASNAPWSVKKKVDLRFHELSDDGYMQKLLRVLDLPGLVSSRKVEQATRVAPEGSPASRRGYLIREFSSAGTEVLADWHQVQITVDNEKKIYRC